MNAKYLDKLEYSQIVELVSQYCKTYIGKAKIKNLKLNYNSSDVARSLSYTDEAVQLHIRKSGNPICEIPDISVYIKQLKSNIALSMSGLYNVAHILKISREIKNYFFEDENFEVSDFPLLMDLFHMLYTNKSVEQKILKVIIDDSTIADDASPKLQGLRNKKKALEQNIRDKLNYYIHHTYSKYVMEPIVTIRNDRYVIPVKEEYRNSIKGFIHDISSSGSTVFIEPLSIFEMNNEITSIKIEEQLAIEEILSELSSHLYPYVNFLDNNIYIIGELDCIFAKAQYSISIDASMPILNNKKQINLLQARHPLIPKDKVVPIDISIGQSYNCLVVTGPNTGGKTVTLKTVGLLLLMAYSGLFIPCKENSSIYVFDQIFADIGDEQSIQESLSTFSSHIANIVEITKHATSNSLILLDELGSGTDPVEGANLAISILQYFYEHHCLIVATTHYPELKNYCLLNKGFENASCEFDIEKLQPTYRLLIGIPGKSNAFAISQKLGLDESILNRAISLVNQDKMSIEELMKTNYDNKIKIEKDKAEIEKNKEQIVLLRKSLEKEKQQLEQKQDTILENAKAEAREILLNAKDEANYIIKELSKLDSNEKNKADKLRNKLNEQLGSVGITSNNTLSTEKLKALNEKFSLKNSRKDPKAQQTSSVTFTKNSAKSQHISSEINVIGLNVEEAIHVLDKYIDDCCIAKISPIRIVHGKGTGKLREGIQRYLKTNSHVLSFRLGSFGEGEMGVTIVELKI